MIRKNASVPRPVNPCWYEFSRFVVRIWLGPLFRMRYFGVENVPRKGSLLVVSNHQSHLDPPLIGAGVPRTMHYLARESLFRFPGFAQLIRSYGAIPLDLEHPLRGLKEALTCLREGQAVLIFPEGTRSPDGEIHPFRKGFRVLAVRSGAMILPTAIEGAFAAWPRWEKFPRPGRIAVRFALPISPDEYMHLNEDDFLTLVEERVRECWTELRRLAFPRGVPRPRSQAFPGEHGHSAQSSRGDALIRHH